MNLDLTDYRDRVRGCFLGKNIGGTVGAPFEWKRQVNDVSFYTQALHGEPLPNDDLDIQLLWLIALEERGVYIDAHVLADYWMLYVTPHWSEYGIAKANMRIGLPPPLCGSYQNAFKHSCGAFIRSEIWACVAPGQPRLAARLALEDAVIDHGDGEGTYAEVFTAALQSAAFVEQDISALLDIALSYIPAHCGVARAVLDAVALYNAGVPLDKARDAILDKHRGEAFFGLRSHISDEDFAKGYFTGERGYDAPSNIAFAVLALLYGGGDFAKTVCLAVNLGEDTDCTAATVGALLGIMQGAHKLPAAWLEPIGDAIKTACLNLGELGYFGDQLPATVEDMTARTERVMRVMLESRGDARPQLKADDAAALYRNLGGATHLFPFYNVTVDVGGDPAVRAGVPKRVRLYVENTYKVMAQLDIRLHAPQDWAVTPGRFTRVMAGTGSVGDRRVCAEFDILIPDVGAASLSAVFDITLPGRAASMQVPLRLTAG